MRAMVAVDSVAASPVTAADRALFAARYNASRQWSFAALLAATPFGYLATFEGLAASVSALGLASHLSAELLLPPPPAADSSGSTDESRTSSSIASKQSV